MMRMIALRRIVLLVIALLPLVTLVHKNDLRRWDINRSAMIAPDEFSYLLTADALLHGPHISTRETLGIDTFYPPGYSLILAAWALLAGLTPLAAHVLNALLVCAATGVVYLFACRLLALLSQAEHRRLQWGHETNAWIALLIAGLFATNWHVLEGALFVLSEPAFMLATFAWLALPLKWRDWHLHLNKTLLVALLAVAAWSIRGAGIVCVALTLLYPCAALLHQLVTKHGPSTPLKRLGPIALVVGLALAYQIGITLASPSKSLANTDAAANSYPHQLLNGITARGELQLSQPRHWPRLAWHITNLAISHLDDYAAAFTPWFRDPPDREARNIISKLFGGLGLLGFIHHLTRRHRATLFLDAYILGYFALYLIWPFNMMRFWSPILPVMLAYVVDAVREFWPARTVFTAPRAAAVLLGLLLVLSVEEIGLQLGHYQRRINLVSDSLARAAAAVVRVSPDPHKTTIAVAGNDEHFIFAWYLPRVPGGKGAGFMPVSPRSPEHVEAILLRGMQEMDRDPRRRLFAIGYFGDPNYAEVFENVRKRAPAMVEGFELRRVFQSENIVSVWEFRRKLVGR